MKVGLELAMEAAYQAHKSKEAAEIGGSQKKLGWPWSLILISHKFPI